jgi:hypothetical protein
MERNRHRDLVLLLGMTCSPNSKLPANLIVNEIGGFLLPQTMLTFIEQASREVFGQRAHTS